MNEILLVIGGGILQLKTFEVCEKLGLKTILVDGDKNCYCASHADFFVECSTKEPELIVKGIKKLTEFYKGLFKIVGVYTQGCDVEYTVAYVANKLKLPSIGVPQAFFCNNKIAMRTLFDKCKIPQPKFCINGIRGLKLPVIVKPSDNCASRGVTIIRNIAYLSKAIENARTYSSDRKVLVEEFIEGEEYSIDTVLYKGVMYNCGISDRVFEKKNTFAVQNGSITPSALPVDIQDEMFQLMYKCAKAIGVTWGAFKGDIIVDGQGRMYPLEVTARLSGGFDSQYRKPVSYGYNLIKATIDMAIGNPLNVGDVTPQTLRYSKTFSILPKPGRLVKILGEAKARKLEGVVEIFIVKKVGDYIKGYTNCADRICHIIICGTTKEELDRVEKNVKKTLRFITKCFQKK